MEHSVSRNDLVEIGKRYQSFNDSAFEEFIGHTKKELEQFDWDKFSTLNLDTNDKDIAELCYLLEAICSSCTTIERAIILNNASIWEIMGKILAASVPTEELQSFKAQSPPDLMQKILEAAQSGKRLTQADLQKEGEEEEELTEEQRKGRDLLHYWGRTRRAILGVIRNAIRFPNSNELKRKITETNIVDQLGFILTSILEEGVNVSYTCTILRFLATNEEDEETRVITFYCFCQEVLFT